jgi:hypothetical protein
MSPGVGIPYGHGGKSLTVTPETQALAHLCSLLNIDPPEEKPEPMFLAIAKHYKGKIPTKEKPKTLAGPKPILSSLWQMSDEGRKKISDAQKARHQKGKA